jgi:EAL domain-containing protein (putative c-di-GMP-specific phosphodiesterase class I)
LRAALRPVPDNSAGAGARNGSAISKQERAGTEGNAHSRAIVKAVVGLARSLGIPVLAEGVETGSQLDVLKSELCDEVQGYLTGRPQPISAYDAVIRSERPGEASRPASVA